MAKPSSQGELFPTEVAGDDVTILSSRCRLLREDEQTVVVVCGAPVAHFKETDRLAKANVMVMLVEHGWATKVEVARAFACDVRTVRRAQTRYDEGGLAALGRAIGFPKGRRRDRARDRRVAELRASGCSQREIARRLGCDEKAIRKRLRRLGWKAPSAEQTVLPHVVLGMPGADPNLSGSPPPSVESAGATAPEGADPNLSGLPASAVPPEVPFTMDDDPMDRRWDRLLAYLGLIDDAAPMSQDAQAVPRAGVLLALPALLATGILAAARETWGAIGPAFYGLRTTMVTLMLLALLRIKGPEALKEHSPPAPGRILGLDRAPEVKTLRRKLERLAGEGGAERFGRLLAQHRVNTHGHALGFLYLDGHVRVYYGQRRIPKTHVARLHSVVAATTDYWVNDQGGDPLFVVTAEANRSTAKVLPDLLAGIRKLVGDWRLTVVFDRGGYSPKLFVQILAAGFDILTYRKGRWRKLPRRRFRRRRAVIDGQRIDYVLADQEVRLLKRKLRLRQVTRLKDDHQTPVLTSRRDLDAAQVAYRMFERWRQENFFKYMREEFLLDALVDYEAEPDDPGRDVPNPKWARADEKLKEARARIAELQHAHFVAKLTESAGAKPRLDKAALAKAVVAETQRAMRLHHRRERIPRRVPVSKTTDEEIIKLATQKKHLTNVIKLVAYQAESELVRLVAPHYRRVQLEGRTLVQSAPLSAADISATESELLITLAPLSSAHRSRAVAALCSSLNATATLFPGTRMRLRYTVAGQP
ncbi:MAG: helix-turn-helix domain-containing protein [Deltaproteobacteria bacterium]|nr:helix-turn-helix domain-containing protein [Deltaproteobacteria bacterium]